MLGLFSNKPAYFQIANNILKKIESREKYDRTEKNDEIKNLEIRTRLGNLTARID